MSREALQDLIKIYNNEALTSFFRKKNTRFKPAKEFLPDASREQFRDAQKIGEIQFPETGDRMVVVTAKVTKELSERSGKKAQYELGRSILKADECDAGIFVFYDDNGQFRFSLIYPQYVGRKRQWSNFRRFTYFSSPELTNKTFIKQIGDGDFGSLEKIKESFSLAKVTHDFYNDFKGQFEKLCNSVQRGSGDLDDTEVRDFSLLFVIRVIFIGFIQKRGWIGDIERFLPHFMAEYEKKGFGRDLFYRKWLDPLFFEALNSPPGTKVAYRANEFPKEVEDALQMAPYLNGGLFQRRDLDGKGIFITDVAVKDFFEFLFAYNFTIEENTLYDEELELNPEFLGIIFERLVNKENGAVYTPRTEVDFMCRMALVKWLEKNNTSKVTLKDLYEVFFREGGPDANDNKQRVGDFTAPQKKELIDLLSEVTVCDPAAGSGAFLVGMLHVLDDVEQRLRDRVRDPDYKVNAFERKQRIISRSLYGVEVKEWAVWITQLRLWVTLFIDAPEELRTSFEPILPSLDFKVRQGDSLVQRVGKKMFPVTGHADISSVIKSKVTRLRDMKAEYFQNKHKNLSEIRNAERRVFKDILGAEIDQKQRKIVSYGDKPEEQIDFLSVDKKDRQHQLELYKERIDSLKFQITELQEEKDALNDEMPLIWNIEFSEIFFDKGGFDIVIGNPPYVRQEGIADPLGKIKEAKVYKEALAEMALIDFPGEFKKEKLNAQSDLYAYFYIRSLRLLNDKGIHVFICSNSWLDVGYGVWLQKFFLNYAPVHFIFDNHSKRSFAAADVNTIISVIGAPAKKVSKEHMVKFVAFKLPFEETIFTENLLEIERAREVVANEKFRVYPIMNEELFKSGLEIDEDLGGIVAGGKYLGEKWGGKFLRAPDIFFIILEKGKGKLVRLGGIADIRFGIKTGANEFFYLDEATVKTWGIEKEFLRSVITSPKECSTIYVESKGLPYKLFFCNKSKDALRRTNALKYIEWGESQKFNLRPSCSFRPQWWSIGERPYSSIFWPYILRERLFRIHGDGKTYVDNNLFDVYTERDTQSLCCTLNSTITILFTEIGARSYGGGGGPLKNQVYEVASLLVPTIEIPNDIAKNFLAKSINPIFQEWGLNKSLPIRSQEPNPEGTRKKVDDYIFDAIGLTISQRKEVYWAAAELIKNRLDKADSV